MVYGYGVQNIRLNLSESLEIGHVAKYTAISVTLVTVTMATDTPVT